MNKDDHKFINELIDKPRIEQRKVEKLQYDQFCDLEFQRMEKIDLIKSSLLNSSASFKFSKWSRCVDIKYTSNPLSSAGSVNLIGQRFNFGRSINHTFGEFQALYIAENNKTALFERFGEYKKSSISACLGSMNNASFISLNGSLQKVLDITNKKRLKDFLEVIKDIKYSSDIHAKRKSMGLDVLETINKIDNLLISLSRDDWRYEPMLYHIPANTQIFGQLVHIAGIEGIVYKSAKKGDKCLVVFPANIFEKSYVKVDDKYLAVVDNPVLNHSTKKNLM